MSNGTNVIIKTQSAKGPTLIAIRWTLDNQDVWFECPSTIPFETGEQPSPPSDRATGYLYLSDRIVEMYTLIEDPKWPDSLPGHALTHGEHLIWLDQMHLTILDEETKKPLSLNLLDKNLCFQHQALALRGRSLTIRLTPPGEAALNLISKGPNGSPTPSGDGEPTRMVDCQRSNEQDEEPPRKEGK